jgi:predicted RNase H-like HicB family nuclease
MATKDSQIETLKALIKEAKEALKLADKKLR